jgi:hypothetical protein
MQIFSNLTSEELDHLKLAPALVTILIGAADDHLDGEERNWSEKLLRARSYAGKKELQEFYRIVSEGFWVELQHQMQVLPPNVKDRNKLIIKNLKEINPILAKLDHEIAYSLYKGLLALAEEVAKASGGFLRIGSISKKEQDLLNLTMLTPIPAPERTTSESSDFDTNIWGEKQEEV